MKHNISEMIKNIVLDATDEIEEFPEADTAQFYIDCKGDRIPPVPPARRGKSVVTCGVKVAKFAGSAELNTARFDYENYDGTLNGILDKAKVLIDEIKESSFGDMVNLVSIDLDFDDEHKGVVMSIGNYFWYDNDKEKEEIYRLVG